MTPDLRTQVVLLLTVSFGRARAAPDATPLSVGEWAQLDGWLREQNIEPAALLKGDPKSLLGGWRHGSITRSRLEKLLNRGGALGFALEKWHRANLWVATVAEEDYPKRLKERLGPKAPPVLFGCGDRSLLGGRGLAVVGSRNAAPDDLAYATGVGAAAAGQGVAIVSGGARGVDERAMLGSLENEGIAIGVMVHGLLRATTMVKYRRHLVSGNLVLLSPFNPEAGFNTGNAMGRNRHVYCLADAAVVVSSTANSGGTWAGAVENLRAPWRIPLWVKRTERASSGNAALETRGACWLPDDLPPFEDLWSSPSTPEEETADHPRPPKESEPSEEPGSGQPAEDDADLVVGRSDAFYDFFLRSMGEATRLGPMKRLDIAKKLDLESRQVGVWLDRGVREGRVRKMDKPVRFQLTTHAQRRDDLFQRGG